MATSSNLIIKYPLDLTGTNPDNLVSNEPHTAPREYARGFGVNYGAFFTKSVRIIHVATGRTLVKGTDYICLELIEDAFRASGQEVCAAIQIKNEQLDGEFLVTYQAIGGEFSTNISVINALLEALALDNRAVKWGDILGLPDTYPPSSHLHSVDDLYGFEYMVEALERIRSAILLGDYYDHEEIRQRIANLKTFLLAEDQKILAQLQTHLDDHSNPHSTTKAQVGLGLVDNFATALQADAESGTSNGFFMTPLRTYQSVAKFALIPLNAHIARVDNPHATTKAQVGLGLVDNFATSGQTDAETGTRNDLMMTPLRVAQAIAKQALIPLNAHIARTDNPHTTTKAQVGLGLVDNYATSAQADAEAGTRNDLFMTPLRVAQAVKKQAGDALTAHIADKTNPHGTTKAQVGLGNVDNYVTATQAEAEAGLSNTLFVTPLRVAQAIKKLTGDALTAHLADTSNPHVTTKAQVGLGSVDNYATATQADAEAGVSNVLFMTPLRVAQAIAKLAGALLTAHINDHSNPHVTTASQVGLGLVANYPPGSQAEVNAGTAGRMVTADTLAVRLSGFGGDYVLQSDVNFGSITYGTVINQIPYVQSSGVLPIGSKLLFTNTGDYIQATSAGVLTFSNTIDIYDMTARSDPKDKLDPKVLSEEELYRIVKGIGVAYSYTLVGKDKETIGLMADRVKDTCSMLSGTTLNQENEERLTIHPTGINAVTVAALAKALDRIDALEARLALIEK